MTQESGLKQIIEVTDRAVVEFRTYLKKQNKPEGGIRVFVTAGGCSGLSYGMVPDDNPTSDDYVIEAQGIKIMVDKSSAPFVAGSVIDYESDNLIGGGFQVKNPNAVSTCGCGQSFKTA
jgi:iron-sulfur cluster assembly protein